jgi:transposase
MATLVDDLVPDQLWAIVEPLLPVPPHPPYGGRHRAIPDRNCFAAIVYMARTSLLGGCCRHKSLAAARRRPAGGA